MIPAVIKSTTGSSRSPNPTWQLLCIEWPKSKTRMWCRDSLNCIQSGWNKVYSMRVKVRPLTPLSLAVYSASGTAWLTSGFLVSTLLTIRLCFLRWHRTDQRTRRLWRRWDALQWPMSCYGILGSGSGGVAPLRSSGVCTFSLRGRHWLLMGWAGWRVWSQLHWVNGCLAAPLRRDSSIRCGSPGNVLHLSLRNHCTRVWSVLFTLP